MSATADPLTPLTRQMLGALHETRADLAQAERDAMDTHERRAYAHALLDEAADAADGATLDEFLTDVVRRFFGALNELHGVRS